VLGLFDASNRDQCEIRRGRTNTPLQALAMMNDPMVLEAARVLAQRLESESGADDEKLTRAFRLIVCRKPTAKEEQRLKEYYQQQLTTFRQDPKSAAKTLAVGEYPQAANGDAASTAALMRVIDTIYNLEETITKT
jgi:hypothetical protein